jgi:hypothetical protein
MAITGFGVRALNFHFLNIPLIVYSDYIQIRLKIPGNTTFQKILYLEKILLETEVKSSPEKLSQLIDTCLIKFGSSEKIYEDKKGNIFPSITQKISIQDFSVVFPSEIVALAPYIPSRKS